ncbi:MAG: hypothetical protein WD512_03325 [Candidatus Paceibacterota bacterium]
MSNLISHSDSVGALANNEIRKVLKEMQNEIKEKHEKVSKEETNPNHVKQKAGMEYVEFPYMKSQANKHYPGWSCKNLEIVEEFLTAGWVVITAELHFIDEGMPRVGAITAAHRIAFKSGMDRIPVNIVDLGNDVKAALTDAMKKGFNTYMNISDDIYRQIEIEDIDENQRRVLYDMIEECNPDDQRKFYNHVDNSVVKSTFQEVARKLLKSLYIYHKATDEDKATKLSTKFKDRLEADFGVEFELK